MLELALTDSRIATYVRERLGATMRALIVDEVFDANDLDISVIEMAVDAGVAVTLVGDPWQALYVFRGARPEVVPLVRKSFRPLFHRAQPRMARRCAAGVSPFARTAVVTGRHDMDIFIITCEHGGNRIPAPYRRLFRGQRALLDSHRGYDPGSLVMAKALASACAGAAGGFDCQPPAYRSQSLDRPPTTFFGGDTRRAGPDPGADRRTSITGPIASRSSVSSGKRYRAGIA